jgi:Toprim-like
MSFQPPSFTAMAPLSSLQVDEARQIPLDAILTSQGLHPHREGSTARYKNDQFNIVTSHHGLWYDNAASVGGRGAIDLALHLRCDVQPRLASPAQIHQALQWLGELSNIPLSPSRSETLEQPSREPFESQAARLAIRDDARWPMVRHYLVRSRRLPVDRVEELHTRGDIYASFTEARPEQTQVCFAHRSLEGKICGATIRTAAEGSGFLFSIGEKQTAWFTIGDLKTAQGLVIVEAPIDAISYQALRSSETTAILATSCSHIFQPILEAAHERGWSLTIALDNDRAGHTGAQRCLVDHATLYPGDTTPHRQCPVMKDWNDDLRAALSLSQGRGL